MPITLNLEIPTLPGLRANFAKAPALIAETLAKYTEIATIAVQSAAMQQAPVGKGTLRNSIKYQVKDLTGTVFTTLNYAEYVERGTGLFGPYHQMIVPKTAKVFATKINPGWGTKTAAGYYIIGTTSKGMHANPFFDRARVLGQKEVNTIFAGANDVIIKSLGTF